MYQKLFRITIVLFFVVLSFVAAAMIVTALFNAFAGPMLAHQDGIVVVAGGMGEKQIAYMTVAGSLIVAGCYLYFRRSRFR